MAPYLAAYFALLLLILCLSHVTRPRLWSDFFVAMDRTGYSSIIIPMYTLPIGLLLVVGHNVWARDWRVLITIAGWGMTTKCLIYLIFPRFPSRMIANAERWQGRFGGFRIAGVLGAAMGAFLSWKALGTLLA